MSEKLSAEEEKQYNELLAAEERYDKLQAILKDRRRVDGQCIFGKCFILKGYRNNPDCIHVYVEKPEGGEYCDLLVHKEFSEGDNTIRDIIATFKEVEEVNDGKSTKERINDTLRQSM